MFRSGELWRHINCLDIDVYIVKVQYRGPDYIKAKVIYYNRNFKVNSPIIDPRPETVRIYRKDFKHWSPV